MEIDNSNGLVIEQRFEFSLNLVTFEDRELPRCDNGKRLRGSRNVLNGVLVLLYDSFYLIDLLS